MTSESYDEQRLDQKIVSYFHRLDPAVLELEDRPLLEAIKVSRIAVGESNMQYLVIVGNKSYVIRMSLKIGNRAEAMKEYVLLQAARPLQIAPRPYCFDATNQFFRTDVTVMEWIAGHQLTEREMHSRKVLDELVKLMAKMHGSDILREALQPYCPSPEERPTYRAAAQAELLDWAENSYQRLMRRRRKYGLKNDDLMRLLRRSLQRERRRLQEAKVLDGSDMVPTHGDIHRGNLLRQPDGMLKVIDWETASIQDPAFEFISMFTWEDFELDEELFLIDRYQQLTGRQQIHERIGIYQAVYLLGVVLDTALRAYLLFAGEFHNDPNIGRSLGFYERDFFICLCNYLNWYTLDGEYTIKDLQKLGRITPEKWDIVEPAELLALDEADNVEIDTGAYDYND